MKTVYKTTKYLVGETRQEAIKNGASRYYGRPCVHCSNTERYLASNSCVPCAINAASLRQKRIKEQSE